MSDTTPKAPALIERKPLAKIGRIEEAYNHPEFRQRLAECVPKHMKPERMVSVLSQAVRNNQDLSLASPLELLGAFIGLAAIGLEANTPLGQAYIIPFAKNENRNGQWVRVATTLQVVIGYKGLVDLAFRSNRLKSVMAHVVWKNELKPENFDYHYGSGQHLFHRPLGGDHAKDELPAFVYMFAQLKDEGEAFEVMPIQDVIAIRNASQGYASAVRQREDAIKKNWKTLPRSYTEAPWIKHPVPMMQKTAIRHGSKWLPMSIELAAAVAWDEKSDRSSGTKYASIIDGDFDVLTAGTLDAALASQDESEEPEQSQLDQSQTLDPGSGFSTQESRGDRAPAETGSGQPQGETQQRRTRGPNKPKDGAPAAGQQQQQQKEPEQPKQPTTTTDVPAFEYYLADHNGEPIGDDPIFDAMEFATKLVQASRVEGIDLAVLLEQNALGIDAARKLNSAARSMIAAIKPAPARTETPAPPKAQPTAAVPIPLARNGGPDLMGYKVNIRKSLEAVTPAFFEAWCHSQAPIIATVPDASQRLQVVQMIMKRAGEGQIPVPAVITAMIAPATPPAGNTTPQGDDDEDTKWVNATISEMRKCKNMDALLAITSNEAVLRRMMPLRTSRPELVQSLGAASLEEKERLDPSPIDPTADDDDPFAGRDNGDPGFQR